MVYKMSFKKLKSEMVFIDKTYKARNVSLPNSGSFRRQNGQSIVAKRKGFLILKSATVCLCLLIVVPANKRNWQLGRDCTINVRCSEKGRRNKFLFCRNIHKQHNYYYVHSSKHVSFVFLKICFK